jgi:hypothetical protein
MLPCFLSFLAKLIKIVKAGWQKGWHPCGCQSAVVGYIASAAVVKRDAILSLALRQFAQVFGGLSAQRFDPLGGWADGMRWISEGLTQSETLTEVAALFRFKCNPVFLFFPSEAGQANELACPVKYILRNFTG